MLLNTLNTAINAYLNADSTSHIRLIKLNGKTFQLTLLPFHYTCYGRFHEGKLHLSQETPEHIHVAIHGTPLQLACLHFTDIKERHRFFANDIHITGDPAIAQEITHIFDEINIDWEEIASHYIGDAPAYRLGQFFVGAKNILKETLNSFTLNMDDFLHEEVKLAPHPSAVEDFLKDVDDVYMRTENLNARLHHLKEKLMENTHEND